MKKHYIIAMAIMLTLTIILYRCSPYQRSNELQSITHEVLKDKHGVEIDVKPIDKTAQKK